MRQLNRGQSCVDVVIHEHALKTAGNTLRSPALTWIKRLVDRELLRSRRQRAVRRPGTPVVKAAVVNDDVTDFRQRPMLRGVAWSGRLEQRLEIPASAGWLVQEHIGCVQHRRVDDDLSVQGGHEAVVNADPARREQFVPGAVEHPHVREGRIAKEISVKAADADLAVQPVVDARQSEVQQPLVSPRRKPEHEHGQHADGNRHDDGRDNASNTPGH